MSTGKHIVITGASGFIGKHVLEDLLKTDHRMTLISRTPEKLKHLVSDKVKVMAADLHNKGSLIDAFKGADVVVNLAAELYNSQVIAQTNVQGTEHLLEAMNVNKIRHLIHLSSVGVVGMQYSLKPQLVDEQTTCAPKNLYEETKLRSEQLVLQANKTQGLQVCILSPTNVYGENHPKQALHSLYGQLKNKGVFISSKNAMANYVYVKDVSAAIVRLIDHAEQTGLFNVGESVPMTRFISSFQALIPTPIKHHVLPDLLFRLMNLSGKSKVKALSNAVIYNDAKLKKVFKYPYGLEKGEERTMGDRSI